MRGRGAFTITMGLLLFLSLGAWAAVLEGRLTNNTPGGRGVGGVEIALIASRGEKEERQTTRTDPKGAFRFTNVAPEERYRVNLRYQGAEYNTEVTFKPGEGKRRIEIPVYDATDDPGVLRVKVHHLLMEAGEGSLLVKELLLVENVGDRAFIGARPVGQGRRATLQFTLPKGADGLQYLSGLMECCIVPMGSGFVDTMDVKPGVREIGFAYTLKSGSDRYTFVRPLDYPTEGVNVFVNGGVKAEGPTLEARGTVEIQGQRYLHLSGKALKPGTSLTVQLHGLPFRSGFIRYLAFVAVVLLLGVGVAYPLFRRRSHPQPAGLTSKEALEASFRELIEAIAKLDDAFEAGEFPPEEYKRLRAERKTALLEVAERLKGFERGG